MSWRIVMISQRAKLELRMGYMVVRTEAETKIHLSEISQVIIEDTGVSLTAGLLCELVKRKIKVVFCDEKRMPHSELMPYYGSHDTSAKVREQIGWGENIKSMVWAEIVREKIHKQADLLRLLGDERHKLLEGYAQGVECGDVTNKEGVAAKLYFAALFCDDFTRSLDNPINAALNYGYTIILSAFNREIVANGCITQLGISHSNMFNQFNLGSDLMEPFRPLCDRLVYEMYPLEFGKEEKRQLTDILNREVQIEGKTQYVNNAIRIYVKSVIDALNTNDAAKIRFYGNEL